MFSHKHRINPALEASAFAANAPRAELERLERLATTLSVPSGDEIVQFNEVGRECFIVIDGEFKIERDDLTVLVGPGSVIGELALITLKPRTASATATRDSTVYVLTRSEFSTLLVDCPNIARYVLDCAVRRAAA